MLAIKWTAASEQERSHFKGRYEFCKSLLSKRIAELKEKEANPPRRTAAEKRGAAVTLAENKRKERGDLLLVLASEYGEERVDKIVTEQNIDWYTVPDKFVRIVKLILKYGADRVNGEANERWKCSPRWLGLDKVEELEQHLAVPQKEVAR